MNKSHDYRALEREYITSQISLRELCRRHGISAHSLVTVQARKGRWQEKREEYQQKTGDAFIEKHADRMADRQAEIHDKILDAIDEALTKFREDMKATQQVRQPDGSVRVEPAWYMRPRDVCHLIDRFHVLFDRPSTISQHRGLEIGAEVTPDALREFLEATRDVAGPPSHESPLPRNGPRDD